MRAVQRASERNDAANGLAALYQFEPVVDPDRAAQIIIAA